MTPKENMAQCPPLNMLLSTVLVWWSTEQFHQQNIFKFNILRIRNRPSNIFKYQKKCLHFRFGKKIAQDFVKESTR